MPWRRGMAGQGTLEYVLIMVVVLLGLIGAVGFIRNDVVKKMLDRAGTQITAAGTALKLK